MYGELVHKWQINGNGRLVEHSRVNGIVGSKDHNPIFGDLIRIPGIKPECDNKVQKLC